MSLRDLINLQWSFREPYQHNEADESIEPIRRNDSDGPHAYSEQMELMELINVKKHWISHDLMDLPNLVEPDKYLKPWEHHELQEPITY